MLHVYSAMTRKSKKLILICGIPAAAFALMVLAAATPHVGREAVLRAHRVKSVAVCVELEQAIQRFFDDHQTLPIEVEDDLTIDCNSAKGLELLRVLLNLETADQPINARGIKYMNIKQGDGDKDGLIWNKAGTQITGLYDPWGGSYMIALDGDFDGSITARPKAQEAPKLLQPRVAVWSNGLDPDDPEDDVTTW